MALTPSEESDGALPGEGPQAAPDFLSDVPIQGEGTEEGPTSCIPQEALPLDGSLSTSISASGEGWHQVGHGDFMASVECQAATIPQGTSQREDAVRVFCEKLARNNVSEGAIATVLGKLRVIRHWLETNECEDGSQQDIPSQLPELSPTELNVQLDATTASEWCYVDCPGIAARNGGFWLVNRDTLQAPLPQLAKLDFGDLAVIEVLLNLLTTKWHDVLTQHISQHAAPLPHHLHQLQNVISVVDCFNHDIRPCFFNWFHTGDIIFYDLDARGRLGVERPNLALQLQKLYDTFSHSAVFLWDDGLPKVLHNLNTRLKVCSWKDCVYMAKRELDFQRIFVGFRFLPIDVQQKVVRLYQEAVLAKAKQSKSYVVESLPFFRGLQYLVTPRQYVANPPLIRRAAGSVLQEPTTEESPTAETGSHNYSEMTCAGFTAGFIFECIKEVQESLPEWQQELAFTCTFLLDVDRMTPKDLHQWDIWFDDAPACPLHDILHPDVLANRDKQPHLR